MFRILGTAVAAAAFAFAGSASADVVLFEKSGSASDASIPLFDLISLGAYKLEAFTSSDVWMSLDYYYNYH